ncbi:Protein of unknown function [Raineyella antarctica]|uniref:DUF2505 domain-containing protein n=1 Tax=Raineyella antarctica TaxID=1577474 RepID=A0A1G6GVH3_9ACTN|nr:DUF2505 domain-containing protein [Raineyella antarctica]SDB85989.1 Protein of unknown function [Raineyella antarctica]
MQISATANFAADPARVYALQTDRAFLEDVCRAGGAVSYDVEIDGNRTKLSRSMPSPEIARKIVGDTITVVETYVWGAASSDGSRTADLQVDVPGTPGHLNGTAEISPTASGSQIHVSGDLVVKIPLLGKKLEQAAAPALTAGVEVQEKVARNHLS